MFNKKWPSEKLCSSCQWTLLIIQSHSQSQYLYHSEYRYHIYYSIYSYEYTMLPCTIIFILYIFILQKIINIINTMIRDWLWYNPSLVIANGWSESEMSDWCVSGVSVDQLTYILCGIRMCIHYMYTVHKHCSVTVILIVIVQLELLIKKCFYGSGEGSVCSSKSKHNELY